MTFTFRPAAREQVSVLIALAGASGSGKTFSALRLAQGLAPGGKIAFIDTEARRGLHYADRFQFMHADMRPPFSPDRFVQAIKAAEDAGAEVIIIDSFSHEYDGEGGIIDWADAEAAAGVKSPGNWKAPKLGHKKLMNALLQCRASLIFCLRADEKIEIRREGNRTQVVPLGWVPICEKRFMFEMTASFTLIPTKPGYPIYSLPHKCQEQHRAFFPEGERIGEAAGQLIAEWARGGTPPPAAQTAGPASDAAAAPALLAEGDDAADRGTAVLEAFWRRLSPADRKAIGSDRLATWKAQAAAIDALPEDGHEDQSSPTDRGAGDGAPEADRDLESVAGEGEREAVPDVSPRGGDPDARADG